MRTGFAFCFALLVVLSAENARADYADTYNAATRAYSAGNWRVAADLMRQARSERPTESGRVRLAGNITEPYVPSYYLGEALMRLGYCGAAIEAFAIAAQTQAANNRSWNARMAEARTKCGTIAPKID